MYPQRENKLPALELHEDKLAFCATPVYVDLPRVVALLEDYDSMEEDYDSTAGVEEDYDSMAGVPSAPSKFKGTPAVLPRLTMPGMKKVSEMRPVVSNARVPTDSLVNAYYTEKPINLDFQQQTDQTEEHRQSNNIELTPFQLKKFQDTPFPFHSPRKFGLTTCPDIATQRMNLRRIFKVARMKPREWLQMDG